MIAVSARGDFATLGAFSRRWWATLHHKVNRGHDVTAMVASARRGLPWRCPSAAVASDVGFLPVNVDSPEFEAWARHFQRHGVRIPRPARAPVIFAPSATPEAMR